ncbi:MAG: tripartite tricarboxylate transporter substrate binding protein [Burkholderiales bacterium]|nr:tripartite tricarboxylate transporter substrate binding protein [Burkholderiales bacterium]
MTHFKSMQSLSTRGGLACSTRRACFAAAALAAVFSSTAWAQTADAAWPARPLRIVVGYPAGTSPDMVARVIAEPLARSLGKPVVVENKPGAAGNIAVDTVARANDGHTIGVTAQGPLTTSRLLYRSLPYDVDKDLQPLSLAATSPQILIVGAHLPIQSMADFVAYARKQKNGLSYGSVGVGSGSHLTAELFASEASVPMVHVPYAGFPQVTSAILGEQIEAAFMAPSGAIAQAKAGKVRILGVTSPVPSSVAPGVPTIADVARLPGFNAELWIGAYAPRSMPAGVAERLSAEIAAALKSPEARSKLESQGWEPVGANPDVMRRRMATDLKTWGGVIERLQIKLE